MLNQNLSINNKESGVKYALITTNTLEGVKLTTHCFPKQQFEDIKAAKKVVIKEISKEEHIKIRLNKID